MVGSSTVTGFLGHSAPSNAGAMDMFGSLPDGMFSPTLSPPSLSSGPVQDPPHRQSRSRLLPRRPESRWLLHRGAVLSRYVLPGTTPMHASGRTELPSTPLGYGQRHRRLRGAPPLPDRASARASHLLREVARYCGMDAAVSSALRHADAT